MSALQSRAEVPRLSAASLTPAHGELPRRGTLVADSELAARALEVAESQAVSSTRDTYASTYAAFVAFLHARAGSPPQTGQFDRQALIAYRDHLASSGRSSATIAKQLSALRTLAAALALDPGIAQVKSKKVPRTGPRSLTTAEYNGLVALPRLNSSRGRRDHAILRVLGECGLRRSELVELTYRDVEEAPRLADPELRRAMARAFGQTTIYVLRVRDAKTPEGARTRPAVARRLQRARGLDPASASACDQRSRLPQPSEASRSEALEAHAPVDREHRRAVHDPRGDRIRSPRRARAQAHVLHQALRDGSRDRGDREAGRPRRHPHHAAIHQRHTRPDPRRDRTHIRAPITTPHGSHRRRTSRVMSRKGPRRESVSSSPGLSRRRSAF
jgi:integrase